MTAGWPQGDPVDIDGLQRKMVQQRRGGYCSVQRED
jgi:arylamine N-acetyltransferase